MNLFSHGGSCEGSDKTSGRGSRGLDTCLGGGAGGDDDDVVCGFIPSPRREGSLFLKSTGPLNRGLDFFTELSTSVVVVRTLT